jgi:hypothetical protein
MGVEILEQAKATPRSHFPAVSEVEQSAGAVSPTSTSKASEADRSVRAYYEVNEKCVEMLVHAARNDPRSSFAFVVELRDLLRTLDPTVRRRIAQRAFLLVDMEFGDVAWWVAARSLGSRPLRAPAWRGSFPRRSAIPLARMTLMLAWHSLRADLGTACILLGMTQPVCDVVSALRFDEIDRIAEKGFRYVRPRWDDRTDVWRRLLLAAQANDDALMGEVNVHSLQLLTGELLAPSAR